MSGAGTAAKPRYRFCWVCSRWLRGNIHRVCVNPAGPGTVVTHASCAERESLEVVLPVSPLGVDRVPAFVDGHDEDGRRWGDLRMVEVERFPKSPRGEAFREARHHLGLTMGDVARALGVGVAEVSGVERGSHAFEDWDLATAALAFMPKRGTP